MNIVTSELSPLQSFFLFLSASGLLISELENIISF